MTAADGTGRLDEPYVSSLTDNRCMVTAEAIMLDGANSVCGASRHPELWHVERSVALFATVALAVALAAILSRRRWTALLIVGVCLVGSVPGLTAVLLTRADAPGRVAAIASGVSRFGDFLARFHQGRRVISVQNDCLECQAPLVFVEQGRLLECRDGRNGVRECLVPPNREWVDPDGSLVLAPDSLRGDCVLSGSQLTCGR